MQTTLEERRQDLFEWAELELWSVQLIENHGTDAALARSEIEAIFKTLIRAALYDKDPDTLEEVDTMSSGALTRFTNPEDFPVLHVPQHAIISAAKRLPDTASALLLIGSAYGASFQEAEIILALVGVMDEDKTWQGGTMTMEADNEQD